MPAMVPLPRAAVLGLGDVAGGVVEEEGICVDDVDEACTFRKSGPLIIEMAFCSSQLTLALVEYAASLMAPLFEIAQCPPELFVLDDINAAPPCQPNIQLVPLATVERRHS